MEAWISILHEKQIFPTGYCRQAAAAIFKAYLEVNNSSPFYPLDCVENLYPCPSRAFILRDPDPVVKISFWKFLFGFRARLLKLLSVVSVSGGFLIPE